MEAVAGGPHSLVGKELKVTLTVQDWWIKGTGSGSQSAIVYNKDPQIKFLEGSAMTFKPDQPFSVHVSEAMIYYLVNYKKLICAIIE